MIPERLIKVTNLAILGVLIIGCFSCQNTRENYNSVEIQKIQSPTGINSGEPHLFSTDENEIYLSWVEKQDTTSTLYYAQLINNRWSYPLKIATGNNWFVNWADYPMVQKNKENYMAHYLVKSGAGTYAYDIMITQSNDGKSWSKGKLLNEDGLEAEHGFVSILPYNDDFLLAWLDGRNTVGQSHDSSNGHESEGHGAMTLRAAIIDANGHKKQEWELDHRICDCCQTSAAMTDNGPVVVYRDRSAEEIRDMSIVRYVDGQWTEPQVIHNDGWQIKGCPVNGPRADAYGNTLAVAWFTGADNKPKVKLIFSGDGGVSFLSPIEIASEGTIGRVDVVMKDEQSAYVSWMEGMQIKVMLVDTEGRKSTVTKIASSSKSRSSGFPQMSRNNDHLLFGWTNDSLKTVMTARMPIPGYPN